MMSNEKTSLRKTVQHSGIIKSTGCCWESLGSFALSNICSMTVSKSLNFESCTI